MPVVHSPSTPAEDESFAQAAWSTPNYETAAAVTGRMEALRHGAAEQVRDAGAVANGLPTTRHIVFRRVRPGDAELFDALDRDPGVLRFIAARPPSLRRQRLETQGHVRGYQHHPLHGRFIAESRDGEFLGWFALMALQRPEVPQLGYRLRPRFWGQGLATEGSTALIDYAFESIKAIAVEAETMFVNTASRRVMAKCGMSFVRTFPWRFDDRIPGTEQGEVLYRITREDWFNRRPPSARLSV
jgi:RimJ/RimL family protein N-acetyltransferase